MRLLTPVLTLGIWACSFAAPANPAAEIALTCAESAQNTKVKCQIDKDIILASAKDARQSEPLEAGSSVVRERCLMLPPASAWTSSM